METEYKPTNRELRQVAERNRMRVHGRGLLTINDIRTVKLTREAKRQIKRKAN